MIRNKLFAFALLFVFAGPSFGAEWYTLRNVTFPERRPITVTNTADVPVNGMPVRIKLDDLKVAADARGLAIIVDPKASPAREDESGGAMVPHQVYHNVLTFSASLGPKEKRTWYLYTTNQAIEGISFKPQTSVDVRPNHAYRSFENNKMAFRVEIGEGANTTGMAIDLFGKTKAGQEMGAILASRIYKSEYHERQDWGIDILKVGSSPGLAGVYVIDGEKMGRNDFHTTDFDVLEGEKGPVMTKVRIHGPVDVKGKKFDVSRTLTLTADDRGIDDVVEIKADPKVLTGIKLGLGLRNLPNETWSEDPKVGWALVDGDGNQAGTEHLGMGFAFVPGEYVRTEVIKTVATATSPSVEDQVNGGRIVVLTPESKSGALVSRHHLGAYWNGDGQINNKAAFQQVLVDWAKLLSNEPKVEIGAPEHAK